MDTVVEKTVDVPELHFQEREAEHIVDSRVPSLKEELVEVVQLLSQDCIQGRLAEQMVRT